MAHVHVIELRRDDERFYPLLGPFLAQRAIVREVGAPLWDDVGKRWFIALTAAGEVVGFAALMGCTFCSAYVLPAWRGQGIYTALYDARLRACPVGMRLSVVANAQSAPFYHRRGWRVVRQRGQFVQMCWEQGSNPHENYAGHENRTVATIRRSPGCTRADACR